MTNVLYFPVLANQYNTNTWPILYCIGLDSPLVLAKKCVLKKDMEEASFYGVASPDS
jgi:hypothetical protein